MKQHRYYLSLGSNIDRERHIVAALEALSQRFGGLDISSVYESEAVGFSGDNFYNLVVGLSSGQGVGEMLVSLREIEDANQRDRSGPRFGPRTLDIDILTCDALSGEIDGIELPRAEIVENAFVLLPLAELAPGEIHPLTGESYANLARDFDKDRQILWAVDFCWRGRMISSA